MRLQPLVAEIAVLLVLEHELLVHHRADAGREAVEDEGGREVLADRELDLCASTALTMSSTLSADQPNWVKMKAGVRLSLITRCSEKATSSAVSGLPEWKVRSGRILSVIVRPSSLTVWLSATPPVSVAVSSAS